MNNHVSPLFADLLDLFYPHVEADYGAALANARAAEEHSLPPSRPTSGAPVAFSAGAPFLEGEPEGRS